MSTFTRDPIERRRAILTWLQERRPNGISQPKLDNILYYSQLPDNSPELKQALESVVTACKPPSMVPYFDKTAYKAVSIRYAKKLAHWTSSGYSYFITFCANRRNTKTIAANLYASIVEKGIFHLQKQGHIIDAYVIMPDHVHLLLLELPGQSVLRSVSALKGFTAREINKELGSSGKVWQTGSFDHIVRHTGLWVRFMDYIHMNPVKDKLCDSIGEYRFSSGSQFYGKVFCSS